MKITSLQNQAIKDLGRLKDTSYRNKTGEFLIEDQDLLTEAYELGIVKSIYYTDNQYCMENIECFEVTEAILKKLSNLSTPSGFVAVCKMTDKARIGNHIIALDGVQDPGNGGTILRSALAFNFDTMLLSKDSFDNYNDKFIRATKGAYFHLGIKRVDMPIYLSELKKQGYKIIACDVHNKAIELDDLEAIEKVVVVVGSEGHGLSDSVKELADQFVYIPMSPNVESLNVGVAATLVMYKLRK